MSIYTYKGAVSVLSAAVFSLNFTLLAAPGRAQGLESDLAMEELVDESIMLDDQELVEQELMKQELAEVDAPPSSSSEAVADEVLEGSPGFPPTAPLDTEVRPASPANGGLFSEYLLGPGDQVRTEIVGYENFDWAASDRVVLSDGKLRLPLIGTITAAGLTLEALEAEVTRQLSRTLVDPEVNMSLVVLRPVVVNIAGDVYRPGPVQLGSLTQAQTNIAGGNSLTTTTTTPTLTAALAAAGGIRRTADIREVTIKRRLPNGQVAEYNVNLWDALQGQSDPGVLVMFDGDSVVVPKATADSGIDQGLLARSSMSPANVRVRVIGEGVVNPGGTSIN